MDNKQFISELSQKSGTDQKATQELSKEAFGALVDILCSGDSAAIPGFGTFSTVKENERIGKDLSTGKTYLFPPHIEIAFTPSEKLKKQSKE